MRNFHTTGRSAVHAMSACAATSSPQATLAALDMLRAGGNAADAAVAASAVLGITEPHMTGIGGDCFVMVGLGDGSVTALNGSGRSSRHATQEWLAGSGLQDITPESIHAVTVPGAIDGWQALLERHGKMSLAEVLQPAIKLAREGCPVGPRTAHDWSSDLEKLQADEGCCAHYLPGGKVPAVGQVMAYPALANTLETIASKGRDGFYTGPVAQDMVDTLQAKGSLLDMEDFAATRASWVEPISTTFRGREVLELPPNGVGLTALVALNILERFELEKYAPESVERRHLEIEAMRLAWIVRNRHVGDPDFSNVPIEYVLSDAFAAELASQISPGGMIAEPEDAVPMPGSDTVYLSVVDENRMAVSFINSVFKDFGSGIATVETGICFQNRGAGFVATPGHPNCIGPAKRPLHTIIPAMVRENGRITHSFGVMGGAYQPMGHVAVLVNQFIYGMDPQEALDFARVFHEDGVLQVEETVPESVLAGLKSLGHVPQVAANPLGGGQIIAIDGETGVLCAGSDHRKDGLALGY